MCKVGSAESPCSFSEDWIIENRENLDRFKYFQTAINVITLFAMIILGKSIGVAFYGNQHTFLNFLYLPLSGAIPIFACCVALQIFAQSIESFLKQALRMHYKRSEETVDRNSENYGSAKILSHLTNAHSEELPAEFNEETKRLYKKLNRKELI
jgi:hypothetical protein